MSTANSSAETAPAEEGQWRKGSRSGSQNACIEVKVTRLPASDRRD